MVLMIDNHDSFTYNLVQYLGSLGAQVRVVLNDAMPVEALVALSPSHLIVSPGPAAPDDAGVSVAAIRAFMGLIPVLGVCLGHQCIAHALGARVVRAEHPMHGRVSQVSHDGQGVLRGLPSPIQVVRYHSLVVENASLPDELMVSARAPDGEIMALRHRGLAATAAPMEGVQYHPESILSEYGHLQLKNFLDMGGGVLKAGQGL